jgi:aminotransferase
MVLATFGEGDGLLVPDPNYNTYFDALRFVRGTVVPVTTFATESFRPDPERVRRALDAAQGVRALLLVSPGNPSASVIAPPDVQALADLAAERDLTILADEIYDRFIYDGHVHCSPASLPSGRDRTLTLNALSKSFAMTGWRAGWVVGPPNLIARVREMKAAVSGPNSIVTQYAALAALSGPQESIDDMRATLARRRQIVTDALDRMGIAYGVPQGGQFIFADIRSVGVRSLELTVRALEEEQLLLVPGLSFGDQWDGHLRITFLQPEPILQDGMQRLAAVVGRI